jgi:hypothetical protein
MIMVSAFLPAYKAADPADLPVATAGSGVKAKRK